MFKTTKERFCEDTVHEICYGLLAEKYKLHVPAFSTSRAEAERACELLNKADTDRESLSYIIEDMVEQRHIVYI